MTEDLHSVAARSSPLRGSEAGATAAGHTLVFVGGLHRSGTSILFKCLREHPAISGFRDTGVPEDEGQHLQTVYRTAKAYGGPGKFGFRPEARLTETSPLATPANRDQLFAEWARHWDTSRPILMEKSPPDLIRARFLQALFPDSRFVMLLRHPIAVSYATKKWSKTTLRSLLRHWLLCHETFLEDRRHLRHATLVRYEDFVADPASTLRRVYAFLELPDHPAGVAVKHGINAKYFERWARDAGSLLYGRYVRSLVDVFESRVGRFGYSLRDPEALQPSVVVGGAGPDLRGA